MARPGLYANIHAKRKRGGKMRKKGAKGAPTAANYPRSKQTARKKIMRKKMMGGGMSTRKMYKAGSPNPKKADAKKIEKTFGSKKKNLKKVDAKKNPGLAKLPTKVRNKMGFMKKGGKVK